MEVFSAELESGDPVRVSFIPGEAAGAIAKDKRIVKVVGDPGDGHKVGDQGTVLSSLGPIQKEIADAVGRPDLAGTYGYFILWDNMPGVPVFTSGIKIKEIADAQD